MNLQSLFDSMIGGNRALQALCYPLSLLFGAVIRIRNALYDLGWLRIYQSKVKVISVGNIVAGGTGKTPLVIALAKELINRGHRVGILSRGYHSVAEESGRPLILSRGEGPLYGAADAGDEPVLISCRVPEAIVVVGADRIAGARDAIKEGADLILLDDGYQHRRLARDVDIACLNAQNPFGHGYLLPRGLLREPLTSLRRADFLVVNGEEDVDLSDYSLAPKVNCRLEAEYVLNPESEKKVSLSGKKVGLFCGIASPKRFTKTVESLGAKVIETHFVADHEAFNLAHLKEFATECQQKGASLLVCTEKDWARLGTLPDLSLPVYTVRAELKVTGSKKSWDQLLDYCSS